MGQNKNYLNAVGTPNTKAAPSADVIQHTKDTAIGKNTPRGAVATGGSPVAVARGSKPRGSWEGYMHAPTARLEANGSGYMAYPKNRGFKRAANLPKFANTGVIPSTKFSMGLTNATHRSMSKSSSMSKLANITKLNKLF